jgi:5-bromo-4-chloroindolyl phosphate hydrolysis protein
VFGNDLNWIISGVVAALLLPLLAWIGVPFWLAAIIAAIAFVGLVVLLSPRKLFEGLNIAAVGKEKVAFAQELLNDAVPAAARLREAAQRITDKTVHDRVMHLAAICQDVFTKVEQNPGNASAVRRFLSYYVPRAAEVSEGYAVLEDKHAPNAAKLAEVGGVIEKLEGAFVHYADGLADSELGSLDVDLKLIQASLKEDLGR